MLESIYKYPKILDRVRRCWLREYISEYLKYLASQNYSKAMLRHTAYWLRSLSTFIEGHGRCKISDIAQWAQLFNESYECCKSRQSIRSPVNRFVRYLQQQGVIPAHEEPRYPFSRLISTYEIFLRRRYGFSDKHLAEIKSHCSRFLAYVSKSGIKSIRSVNRGVIQKFIISEGQYYAQHSMSTRCSWLRRFLSYLHSAGKLKRNLSVVVVAPRIYQPEHCPRFLKPKEITAALKAIDRRTTKGKRDYAMLLLLSTYGLRGIEGTQLRLENINWRAEKIHIVHRKAGNNSVYPLTPEIAEAILSYLMRRPQSRYREVFLSCVAPYSPITTGTIRAFLRKYLRKAGINTERVGAHTLRYSCAQKLFEDEFSLKVIGDYLGHRHLKTTRRYLKMDINHLREVALNNGEDLL